MARHPRVENHIRTFELTPGTDVNWNQINALLKRMGSEGWQVTGFQFSRQRVAIAFSRPALD
ncbi:MAG: hypothetical protein R3E98_16845 [Gemmatimonadota bacterium]|nr:hypothetical protein [Gemmatimonadota bacterium]